MQIIGDLLAGLILVVVGYKVFTRFGWWIEKKGEKAIEEIKKEPKHG